MVGGNLRERKKRQTREAISRAARQLFIERGFAAVTIADIAGAADVSEATVFNYFATKEDLFFSGMHAFEEVLVGAVAARPSGESVLEAFRRALMGRSRALSDPRAAHAISTAGRVISETRALQDRERAVVAEHTGALAEVLRAERRGGRGGSVEPVIVASALMQVHAALLEHVRELAMSGVQGDELARAFGREARRAFKRLEHGLHDYGVRMGGKGT